MEEKADPRFEVSVRTPDEVREFTVDLTKTPDPETVQGLETVLVTKDNGPAFSVVKVKCGWCGYTDDYKKDEETECRRCGHSLYGLSSKERDKEIRAGEVKGILDNQLMYRCPDCGKEYASPQLCCNKEFVRTSGSETFEGYLCPDCGTVYREPRRCCSGRLVLGDFYGNPDASLVESARNALISPVEMLQL